MGFRIRGLVCLGGFISNVSEKQWPQDLLLLLENMVFCVFFFEHHLKPETSQVAPVVKNLPANAGEAGDTGSIPVLRRCPGGGHDSSLQYSCLENPMDRGAWQAMVYGVARSKT